MYFCEKLKTFIPEVILPEENIPESVGETLISFSPFEKHMTNEKLVIKKESKETPEKSQDLYDKFTK